MSYFLMTAQVK